MSLHITRVPVHEIRRESVGERFCFNCRKKLPHDTVVFAPDDIMSYYGPHWQYECSRCGKDAIDFPGTFSGREWQEPTDA